MRPSQKARPFVWFLKLLMFGLHVEKRTTKRHVFFRSSVTSPHRATKPGRGWFRVVVRKPRFVLVAFMATRTTELRRQQCFTGGGVAARSRDHRHLQSPSLAGVLWRWCRQGHRHRRVSRSWCRHRRRFMAKAPAWSPHQRVSRPGCRCRRRRTSPPPPFAAAVPLFCCHHSTHDDSHSKTEKKNVMDRPITWASRERDKKNTLPVAARLAVHLHGDTEAGDNAEHAVLWVRRSFGEREADPRDLVIAVTHEQGTQCQAVLSRWTRDVKQRY